MKKVQLDKFVELERRISNEKGEFALFALFAREDLPDRWDLVFSAGWSESPSQATEHIVGEIQSLLGAEELTNLSRVVFVAPSDPRVQAINKAFHVAHGVVEIQNSNFFGLPIRHAYIITSQFQHPARAK